MNARSLAIQRVKVLLAAAWLRKLGQRDFVVIDDRGPRVLWPWSEWPEEVELFGIQNPTVAEIIQSRGWR